MSTPNMTPTGLATVSSIAVPKAPSLQTLPTEILLEIIQHLHIWHQRCIRCNDVQSIWHSESTFLHMALACDRFKDIMTEHGFLPDRAVRGNHLIAAFTCSCVSRRVTSIAAAIQAAEEAAASKCSILVEKAKQARAARAAKKTRQPTASKITKSSSTKPGGKK